MSKETDHFFENLPQPERPMGGLEATVEGMRGSVTAFFSGVKEVGGQIWDGGKVAFDHGRTEAAAALFSGHGNGFVMYGHDSGKDQAPDHGLPPIEAVKQPEAQQEKSRGMEM